MAEFCPRCPAPLETSRDADRLCEVCGWFGDQQEALLAPPASDVLNPVLAAAQTLELYRDVCRKELVAEQIYDAGNATEAVSVGLYRMVFRGQPRTGLASALAYMVLIVIIGISNVYIWYLNKIKEA